MGTQNSGPGQHAGRRFHPPSPNKATLLSQAQKARHLLHGDGVDEPGIGALGEKERKREKIQALGQPHPALGTQAAGSVHPALFPGKRESTGGRRLIRSGVGGDC